jgi:hypothetical protein
MVLVLTVMAAGVRRCILVDLVVGVAELPTYLPCAREKRAQRGEMEVSNLGVREGGRNRGAVSVGADESSCPLFLLHVGARAISMVASAHAGVDHF